MIQHTQTSLKVLGNGGLTWPLSGPCIQPSHPSQLWSWGLGCPYTHLAPYLAMLPSPRTWRLQLHRGGQELQAWGGGLRARSQSMPSATLMAPGSAAAQAGAWPGPVCPACPTPLPEAIR